MFITKSKTRAAAAVFTLMFCALPFIGCDDPLVGVNNECHGSTFFCEGDNVMICVGGTPFGGSSAEIETDCAQDYGTTCIEGEVDLGAIIVGCEQPAVKCTEPLSEICVDNGVVLCTNDLEPITNGPCQMDTTCVETAPGEASCQ